ncbi:hypothetical protein [Saccharibacillus alkalitolerans]|uniref:Uncharacterized protein n=1 Tax=Saccharibacillus alkalitolerans TaxID=2705290 RepID=A0ABX0F496_9BACL|nr:hypothetical protein [Saccharibacillus alkalitolerans]NGZ75305.1 hypothetical protein [Saccharibacillus alkalitolerans]
MNPDLRLLNRENVMVYRGEDTTLLKTSYKTLKFRLDAARHERLLDILRKTKGGASLAELAGGERGENLKLIKMLTGSGVLFAYGEGDAVHRYGGEAWFPILAQYWPHADAPHGAIERIVHTPIAVSRELAQSLPELEGTFENYGKKAVVYDRPDEVPEEALLITANRDDLNGRRDYVLLQAYNSGWCGTAVGHLEYKRLTSEIHPLLRKFGPFYLLIFALKRLAGFGRDTFYINENIKFIETDSLLGEIEVVSTSQAPLTVHECSPIERIDRFERYLTEGRLGLRIANQSDEYGRLKQIGFSAYGIRDTSDREEYGTAGLNFEENGVDAIIFALERHFAKQTGGEWLVAKADDYYYRKTQLLLGHLEESGRRFKLDSSARESVKTLRAYRDFLSGTEICLEHFPVSGSYKVWIADPNGRLFGSGLKTIRLREELERAVVHYICRRLNEEVRIRLPFDARETETDPAALPWGMLPEDGDESAFIEKALELFKAHNIRYEERAWSREYELLEAGLCARRIDVGEYSA